MGARAADAVAEMLDQPVLVGLGDGLSVLAQRDRAQGPLALVARRHRHAFAAQRDAEPQPCAGEQRPDGRGVQPDDRADLVVGQAQQLAQGERLALALGELRRGVGQLAGHRLGSEPAWPTSARPPVAAGSETA